MEQEQKQKLEPADKFAFGTTITSAAVTLASTVFGALQLSKEEGTLIWLIAGGLVFVLSVAGVIWAGIRLRSTILKTQSDLKIKEGLLSGERSALLAQAKKEEVDASKASSKAFQELSAAQRRYGFNSREANHLDNIYQKARKAHDLAHEYVKTLY